MTTHDEFKSRFLARIAVDEISECWNWTASRDTHGYGHLKQEGRIRLAHRVSYELHRGPIGEGMQVCHHCDNRACVNPSHLFLGTWRDNMMDKLAKNRQSRNQLLGEVNPAARLTAKDIITIRASDATHDELAAKFGVARAHITNIRSGKRWGHIKCGTPA